MHLVLLFSDVDFVVRVRNRGTDLVLECSQRLLVFQQFVLLLVELLLYLLDPVELLAHLFLHLLNVCLQICNLLLQNRITDSVLLSVFSRARKLLSLISYSAFACAIVFWLLSPLATVKLGPVGSWFEI